jgi:hypothetical protein
VITMRFGYSRSYYADHGDLSEIMSADGGDCEAVLDQFAAAGIEIDQLAAKLQDDRGRGIGSTLPSAGGQT